MHKLTLITYLVTLLETLYPPSLNVFQRKFGPMFASSRAV